MTQTPLTYDEMKFIQDNESRFTTSNPMTPEQRQTTFNIYNRLTGEKKRATSCGRCQTTVKQYVYSVYLRQKANLQ